MKLDPDLLKTDERFSNHAIQGFSTPECPIDKGCFAIATGFGGAFLQLCKYLKYNDENVWCKNVGLDAKNWRKEI